MVRTSFPEIGAEHMLQSLTVGCGTFRTICPDLPRASALGRTAAVGHGSANGGNRRYCDIELRASERVIFAHFGHCSEPSQRARPGGRRGTRCSVSAGAVCHRYRRSPNCFSYLPAAIGCSTTTRTSV